MPGTDLRASDADRESAAAALREACGRGQLSVDEMEDRLGVAYAATMVGELLKVLEDIAERPSRALAGVRTPGLAEPRPRPRLRGGRLAFTERVELAASPETCRTQALEYIAPLLARRDYQLMDRGRDHLSFGLEYRPTWTILLAIVAFPLGLAALLVKEHERIDIDFSPGPAGGTRLLATGKAPKAVRRAFAELRD